MERGECMGKRPEGRKERDFVSGMAKRELDTLYPPPPTHNTHARVL